jgi:hypothetical protein
LFARMKPYKACHPANSHIKMTKVVYFRLV